MPYAEATPPLPPKPGDSGASLSPRAVPGSQQEMYTLFESLNGELLRQKIMFESELRRQREAMGARMSKLEADLEQREADYKSLQKTVQIYGKSISDITEALERVAPTLASVSQGRLKVGRGRAASSSSGRPSTQPQRGASPKQRTSRPPSPDRRPTTPRRERSSSAADAGRMRRGVHQGAVPIISSRPLSSHSQQHRAVANYHRGPTAVREVSADYMAGIRYPPFLQSSIFPPEGMEDLQSRKSQLPDAKLELQHIYGCSVDGYNDNVCYAGSNGPLGRCLVTYAASVGVVLNTSTRQQNFCFHHTGEVTALALHPSGTLVATGQGGTVPTVAVWEVATMTCRATLKDFHEGAIACMAFSPDGSLLATFGADAHHSLAVYRWETKEILAHCRMSPLPIYNATFNPFSSKMMAVVGRRAVKFVEVVKGGAKVSLKIRQGAVVRKDFSLSNQRVVCAAFTSADHLVTGTDSGSLLLWAQERLVSVIPDVHEGGVSSIRALSLHSSASHADLLFCAGRDGIVRVWKGVEAVQNLTIDASSSFNIAAVLKAQHRKKNSTEHTMEEVLRSVTTGKAPVRSMAVQGPVEDGGGVLKGVKLACVLFSNQIVEVDLEAVLNERPSPLRVLLQGHSALPTSSLQTSEESEDVSFSNVVGGVAAHPIYPIAATVGSDATLRFWNTLSNELCYVTPLPGRGLCIDIAPDGNVLVVGLEAGVTQTGKPCKGGAAVFAITGSQSGSITSCKLVCRLEDSEGESAFCVRYDPAGQKVALGGSFNRLDIYDATEGYRRVAITKGHTSEVRRLDWSLDGSLIQTDDRTPEHLYFTHDGTRVTRPVQIRSQRWGRWTCAFGWHIQGIWDETRMDANSVTAVDRALDGDLCVIGDSAANVSLFTFPVPMPHASHKKYRGHADEVTGLAFSTTNSNLYSAAADGCLFQWTVVSQSGSA